MLDPGTQIPDGYTAGPASQHDLALVAGLMGQVDRAIYGETAFGEDFLRGEWERPRFDLATDTLVIRDAGGDVAAYVAAFDEDVPDVIEGMGMVHPDHLGRGLGTILVQSQEDRAARQAGRVGDVRLRSAIWAPDLAAKELLGSRGYRLVRSFFHMEIEVGDDRPPAPPAGIDARRFVRGQDESLAHQILQASFRGQWGHHEVPFDQWMDAEGSSGFDPALSFVAVEGAEAVGAVLGSVFEGDGWVGELAVLPDRRGRGIGRFLLRVAFEEFRRQGHPRVLLNVDADNEAGALRVYERAGMHPRRQWDLYEKELAPAMRRGAS
jgi:mycothiol synthase